MHRYLTTAIIASTALVPASAADAAVFTYTFYAEGTGSRVSAYDASGAIVTAITGAIITIGVDVQPGSNAYFAMTDARPLLVLSSGTGLKFYDYTDRGSAFTFSGAGTACFANAGGLLPTSAVSVDPSCGSLAFTQGTPGGFGGTFTGTITGFDITAGGSLGLTRASFIQFVPEPTTWTLMLAGFALTGYALRRRRARVAFG